MNKDRRLRMCGIGTSSSDHPINSEEQPLGMWTSGTSNKNEDFGFKLVSEKLQEVNIRIVGHITTGMHTA